MPKVHRQSDRSQCRRAVWLWATVVIAGLLAESPRAVAQDDDDAGLFRVRSVNSELVAGVYFVNALLELNLSGEAREALESGVPLIVHVEVDLIRIRRFWIDDEEYDVDQRFSLEYHALTERYIVRNLNGGEQASFATLSSALNYLGRIERLPFIDATLLDPQRGYDARIRAELDMDEFSGPLRLLTFWRREFSLSSDWLRWRLQEG